MSKKDHDLDVLFIVPPLFRFIGIDMQSYPLGLGYMVSYLKNANVYAEIYNADYMTKSLLQTRMTTFNTIISTLLGTSHPIGNIAKKWPIFYSEVNNTDHDVYNDFRIVLKKTNPKIIGISSRIVDIPSTLLLAKIAKEVLPNVKIVIGGASASSSSTYLMKSNNIDFLVIGEGEETILELVTYLLDFKNKVNDLHQIKGIMCRNNGDIIRTESRPLISNLDDIPFPDRNSVFILDKNKVIKYIHQNVDVITSRGCPYLCKFCCAYIVWGTRKPRFRSVGNIIDEIIYLKNTFGQTHFIFWDDLFTSNRNRVIEFCNTIIERQLNITWICLVRINTIDAELLSVMKKAGCVEIQIGIESGNDRILKHINKNITLDQIHQKIPIIRQSGINWLAFFIIGFPSETESEIMDTLNLVNKIKPTSIAISIFSPYPGTEFYSELEEKKILGENVMKSDVWYVQNNFTGTMDDDKFKAIVKKAFEFNDRYNQNRMKILSKIFKRITTL